MRPEFVVIALTLLAACAAIVAFWQPGEGDGTKVDTGAAPGYVPDERTLDTSPFDLAGPSKASTNTTLPGLDPPDDAVPTTAMPTTTIAALPAPGSDPFCRGAILVADALRSANLGGNNPNLDQDLPARLLQAADLFEGTGDTSLGPLIEALRSAAAKIAERNTEATVLDAVLPLIRPTEPALTTAITHVQERTQTACAGLGNSVD